MKERLSGLMKLIDIKGKREYIRFIMEDGTYFKGNGEMLYNGFCVYESTLLHFVNESESNPLTYNELISLKDEIAKLTCNSDFEVIFQ